MSFYKLVNVTFFAASLKELPMGCKDAVLPEPFLKNSNVSFLTFDRNTRQPYNDNLCLFTALALHLHAIEGLEEETSKMFNLFLEKFGGTEPANFRGARKEDIAAVEKNVPVDIFLLDIDILNGSMISELARKSPGKHFNTVQLLSYNSGFCFVFNTNALFKHYHCPSCGQFNIKAHKQEWHWATCKKT